MNSKLFSEKLKLFVKRSESLSRWKEWNTSKLSLIFFVFYYLIVVSKDFSYTSLSTFFNFVAFICLYASFGYMINDFADRDIDKRVGKSKESAHISPCVAKLLLFSIFLLGWLISLPLWIHNINSLILLITMYLLSAFYSLPPVRFKERGWMGIVVASITQRVLPPLLCFAIFNYYGWDSLIFLLLFFVIGVRYIVVHQIKDYKNDLKTGVKTFVTSKGILKVIHYFLVYIVLAEIILLTIALTYTFIKIPLLGIFVGGYLLIAYQTGMRATKEWLLNSILVEETFLNSFYSFYFPFFFTIILSFLSPKFLILAVFQLIWSNDIIENEVEAFKVPKIVFYGQKREGEDANEDFPDKLWHCIDNIFYFEWWYFDAIFNDNLSLAGSLSTHGYHSLSETIKANVDFTVNIKNEGKMEIQEDFDHEKVILSGNMVSIGKNKIEKFLSNNILHLKNDNYELILNFRKTLSEFIWGRNGRVVFTTGGDRYLAWLISMPRAEVSGVLKTPKGILNLNGVGYHDHTWGTISLKDNISNWHWGRIHFEELTLIFADVVFKNRTRVISLAIGKEGKMMYTNSKISRTSLIAQTCYKEQKLKVPSSFKIVYKDREICLNLNFVVEKILKEKPRPRGKIEFFSRPFYTRFLSNVEGRIVLDGKELLNGYMGRALHEHSVF